MEGRVFDIAVIGGSLGGVQAARAAASYGLNVYLCESTDWIGGQLTSQAVPPDEHRWIEEQGATRTYRAYRKAVRNAYRDNPAASPLMQEKDVFCPGNSWVSRVAHEPRLAHELLEQSLQSYVRSGRMVIETGTRCVEAEVQDDRIVSVVVEDKEGQRSRIEAQYFLDGTDTGDLLPLAGARYRIGAESRAETGEPDAPEIGNSKDHQPITWVAALELTKERQDMDKPAAYEEWRKAMVKDTPQLGWDAYGAHGLMHFAMFDNEPGKFELGLWTYRRIVHAPYYLDGRNEVTLLNWPQNDYAKGNIIDDPHAAEHLEEARELTRCCAYWLWEQGYPVRLNGEVVGTQDGLAMAPYIRESRRMVARKTVLEQELLGETGARYEDSIGVGHYNIDLHTTTQTGTGLFIPVQPFEIPLGVLISEDRVNLIPACKNIGTTHLTGGCFRLHPVEWTVGEAAGHLAAFCISRKVRPADITGETLKLFQALLIEQGFQLHWRDLDEGEKP